MEFALRFTKKNGEKQFIKQKQLLIKAMIFLYSQWFRLATPMKNFEI